MRKGHGGSAAVRDGRIVGVQSRAKVSTPEAAFGARSSLVIQPTISNVDLARLNAYCNGLLASNIAYRKR